MIANHQQLLPLLATTPWRHLLAMMARHTLSTSTRQTKAQLITQLQSHLRERQVMAYTIAQLDSIGKDAVRAVLTNGGALPVHTFEARFGPIRPYRPWRQEEPTGTPPPWLAPISTTETLWYRGLLFRDPPKPQPGQVQHYVIPADLIPPLTDLLQQPAATVPTTTAPLPGQHGPLTHHLAIWLATVHAPHQGQAVAPVHQRWLPPSVVALLCQRLGLAQAPGFRPIKSERHHPYLAFLHYLALAADLIAVTPAAFQLPLDLPWAMRQALRAQLTASQQATAESLAHRLLEQLQAALNGYLRLPAFHLPPTTDPAPLIRSALDKGQDLELSYRGPGDGPVTTRTVTPYWIEERHGIPYLIGWCHLRQEERVFRIDRIEAVALKIVVRS